jgi:chromosome segregation ATPase
MHISIRLSCSQRKNLDEKVNILKNEIETVNTNIEHLNGGFIRLGNSLQRLSEECSSLKNNCQEQNISINKLKLGQDTIEKNLLEIQQKMEDYHYATYDGSLVWIIPEVEKKFRK